MNCFKHSIFVIWKFFDLFFGKYIKIENSKHSDYKTENTVTKYLNNMRKTSFLKIKNSLLELEKYFIELKDKELKDRDEQIKREI